MDAQHDDGVALTAFDRRTAAAVVTVLQGAGVSAWTGADDGADVEVRVAADDRDRALTELGARMEEVHAAVSKADRQAPRVQADAPLPDPDDVHAGPPLVMERFRSMRYLTAIVLAPLLVVTLAPTLRGGTGRMVVIIGMGVVAGLLLWRARRQR
ncbi:hypothetical protein BH23ACT9_BH23ACT9_16210 [soil metagenome]